ncbi:Uncharacterised protein [Salmonella enterica subsp. arizonae]|uniref:Uncharacterized protein n=1 Tax=Salmonella enterica subsp. arizonae TaxID=59203 RepID=A0A379SXB5_SALER|nr:Uncharacterised protein [Salmonella enterica subsp. arizonae]
MSCQVRVYHARWPNNYDLPGNILEKNIVFLYVKVKQRRCRMHCNQEITDIRQHFMNALYIRF